MSPTTSQSPLKIQATMAAALAYDTAAAIREPFAAFVSFRWQQASLPLAQNVNSAPCSLTPACHFSGNYAINAANAVTPATFTTFTALYCPKALSISGLSGTASQGNGVRSRTWNME